MSITYMPQYFKIEKSNISERQKNNCISISVTDPDQKLFAGSGSGTGLIKK
jgi:hypothetical protein